MNHDTIVLLIRAMLTCLDQSQAKALKHWMAQQEPDPDPASDAFSNAERRRIRDTIEKASAEIDQHFGFTQ